MCGRYSNALPSYQYIATVEEQLRKDDERRRERNEKEAESSRSASQRSKGAKDSSTTLKDADALPLNSALQEEDYYPTHNVAPSSRMPILRLEKPVPLPLDGETDKEGKKLKDGFVMRIEAMRWGLLPSYTKAIPHGGDSLRTINARDDSVLSGGGMWTPLLKKGKRCVIFAQGFYEWLKKSDGSRVAHFVGMLDEGNGRIDVNGKGRALMAIAGLYERCYIDEQEVYSFTIITTDSNKQLNFLHDRMPVILPTSNDIMSWLGATSATSKEICSLLKPYDAGQLDCYPVPREVGRVGNDDESFILPVKARKDGIAAAFGRIEKKAELKDESKDVNSESNAPLAEEIKAVDSNSKKRQLKEDEEMARSLQQQEEEKSVKKHKAEGSDSEQNVTKDEVMAQEIKAQEGGIKSETKSEAFSPKREGDSDHHPPSSRFSPEPFNPPVSPPRPNGGYTTVTSPNLTYIRRKSAAAASPSSATSSKLEQAAKGTKDIRNFFK